MRAATELITESEVSHRLVDRAIGELRPTGGTVYCEPSHDQSVRETMRDELFGLLAHLHFHDISARELDYAAGRIAEMKRWLESLDETVDLPR